MWKVFFYMVLESSFSCYSMPRPGYFLNLFEKSCVNSKSSNASFHFWKGFKTIGIQVLITNSRHAQNSVKSTLFLSYAYKILIHTWINFHFYLHFQNIHVSFLRTVPPYSHQANVWVEMLKQFKYRQLVFIHSSGTKMALFDMFDIWMLNTDIG